MTRLFQRRKEDFTCEHCGFFVTGNGYTNHCPKCLWCKHVDIHPGDRASQCQGMMRPDTFAVKKQDVVIVHLCEKCGFIRRNKRSDNDAIDALVTLKQKPLA